MGFNAFVKPCNSIVIVTKLIIQLLINKLNVKKKYGLLGESFIGEIGKLKCGNWKFEV